MNEILERELEDDTEEEYQDEKTPRLFPMRLGFLSFLFIIFYIITVLLLNITSTFDAYQNVLDWIRTPITNTWFINMYDFLMPYQNEWDPLYGKEALFISSSFVMAFATIGLLSKKERFKNALFSGNALKRIFLQILVFFLLFLLFIQLMIYLSEVLIPSITSELIPMYVLTIGAIFWLLFQTYAFFTASRRSGTRIEASLSKKRGSFGLVAIAPLLVMIFVIVLTTGFNMLIDYVDGMFTETLKKPYWDQLIFYTMFAVIIFCILPTLIAMASDNRRRKMYDNFSFLMTIFYMFPYILFNYLIFFIMNPEAFEAITGGGGGAGGGMFSQILMWAEMLFTLILLILSMRSVGGRTNYKVWFLDKHSLIVVIYAVLSGQFGIRYLQTREILSTEEIFTYDIGNIILNYQNLIVNIGVLFFMFLSIFMFASKKFSVIFKVHEQVSKADKKRIQYIHEYLKQEYTRREEPFLTTDIYESLVTVMKLDKREIMSLLEKTQRRNDDLRIDGLKKRWIYFV